MCLSAHTLLCFRTPSTGTRKRSCSSCGPCTASSTWLLARRPRPSTCPDSPPPVTWEVRTPHQELVPPAPCTSFVGLSHWGFTCLQDRKQVYLFKKHPKDSGFGQAGSGLGQKVPTTRRSWGSTSPQHRLWGPFWWLPSQGENGTPCPQLIMLVPHTPSSAPLASLHPGWRMEEEQTPAQGL